MSKALNSPNLFWRWLNFSLWFFLFYQTEIHSFSTGFSTALKRAKRKKKKEILAFLGPTTSYQINYKYASFKKEKRNLGKNYQKDQAQKQSGWYEKV